MRARFFYLLLSACLFLVACDEQAPVAKKELKQHLVEVAKLQRQIVAIENERSGTLTAVRDIEIYNQEEGKIVDFPFYEGDRVKKGDIIAKLDDKLLRAQLFRAQALRTKAEKDLLRLKELAKKGLTSQIELTRMETELAVAQADERALLTQLDFTVIRSPISGLVSERLSEKGNIAERYTHLMTVSDQSSLLTEVSVSELLINKLKTGDKVELSIDALGPQFEPLVGTISRIFPNLDPFTRTGTVEITLNPVPVGARPGQLVRVILRTEQEPRLLIPFNALRHGEQGDYVFTINEQQQAEVSPVVIGSTINGFIDVLRGLNEGDKGVVRGYTNLKPDKKVTIVNLVANEK